MSEWPVFIGGLAFSGKTPLRIALSAHPRLALTRRTAMWTTYHGRFGDLSTTDNLDRCLTRMLSAPAIAALHPDRADIERRFADGPATYAHLFATIHQQHADRLGKRRWGDQMGMLEQHADLVLRSYPTARMIHMIRDPRARYRAARDVHRQLPGKLGWEVARWRHSAELAVRNRTRFSGRYLVVRFEQLRDEPESTLRAVCAFIGEDYEPAMGDALRQRVSAGAPSDDGQPARGENAVSAFVDRHVAPQLRAHGYDVAPGAGRHAMPAAFYLIDLPCNRAGITLWRLARSTGRGQPEAA